MFERTEAQFARMAEQEEAALAHEGLRNEIDRLRAVNARLVEALKNLVEAYDQYCPHAKAVAAVNGANQTLAAIEQARKP